jgi:hypothetical protein
MNAGPLVKCNRSNLLLANWMLPYDLETLRPSVSLGVSRDVQA